MWRSIGLGICALGSAYMLLSWVICTAVLRPKKNSIEKVLARECANGNLSRTEFERVRTETFELTDAGENTLRGCWLFPYATGASRVIVCCHGFRQNRMSAAKYAMLFVRRGWVAVIYDHRSSGISGGRHTTMGYLESPDLMRIVDMIHARFAEGCVIATHGESMGAATVILHASQDKRIAFAIADCAYADLTEQIAYLMKIRLRLPAFPVVNLASLICRIRAGFFFSDVSPIRCIQESNGMPDTPILFIHGLNDTYIPPETSLRMHAVKKGVTGLCLIPGAGHARSYAVDTAAYEKAIDEFLSQAGLQ